MNLFSANTPTASVIRFDASCWVLPHPQRPPKHHHRVPPGQLGSRTPGGKAQGLNLVQYAQTALHHQPQLPTGSPRDAVRQF
jgi:hypothetical protein